ncbi:hypothetical protein FIA58_015080 [Flavobacterium jejuense]|uniref:Outer membrane protein beta-barrel domain-containing protein n=1 Tax=Flavobacterium jejuense TaxID=1544455 RepID=A0ABX0ISZ0_9FLAO|nr:hypothetical protein [Flavobacterium jejuense]NHN27005.1 hypothetical protein [Flavobacterium jejuense]
MKTKTIFILLFISYLGYSQDTDSINTSKVVSSTQKITFTQFDLTIPFKGNKKRGETFADGSTNDNWFIPDGVGAKFGYGLHHNKWIGVSVNSGIDFYASYKLIALPVFTNFRISPKIGQETRITAQYGLGQSFAIGRGNLQGSYQKASIGLENGDGICLFIEGNYHGYTVGNYLDKVYNFSIGICLFNF